MQVREKDIVIYVSAGEQTWTLRTYEGEYRSLMALIKDQVYTEYFGDCGGIGRCGTCAVVLPEVHVLLEGYSRNEATTLERLDAALARLRLSCQVPVTAALHGMHLRVLEI